MVYRMYVERSTFTAIYFNGKFFSEFEVEFFLAEIRGTCNFYYKVIRITKSL